MTTQLKYPFTCAKCGQKFPTNSEGWISPKTKKVYCKACLEKQLNTSPTRSEGTRQPNSITGRSVASSSLEDADAYARDLYKRAERIIHERNPEYEEMSEYPYLLAVLIQTMHGKLSGDRIAEQEEKKLKAYGGKF